METLLGVSPACIKKHSKDWGLGFQVKACPPPCCLGLCLCMATSCAWLSFLLPLGFDVGGVLPPSCHCCFGSVTLDHHQDRLTIAAACPSALGAQFILRSHFSGIFEGSGSSWRQFGLASPHDTICSCGSELKQLGLL
jgi:hypothetical protein